MAGLRQAGPSGSIFAVTDPSASQERQIRFENRQPQTGIDFVLRNGTTEDKPIIDSVLGGVAVFDFDNDGFLDIFFTNGAKIATLEKDNEKFHNRLYRNNHDGTFTDVTHLAGVAGEGYSMGVAAGDYDNDGWVDLYVAGVNRNILYHNNGDGTFTDVTDRAGVRGNDPSGKKPWSVAAAWIDYDNDGKLDLFVVNYLDWSIEGNKVCGDPGKRLSCLPTIYNGLPNILYHNNGDGTFSDVSVLTEISRHIGKGMSVALADYDGDGFTDIFVTNDTMRNFLFRNLAGRSFAEAGIEAGVAYNGDGMALSGMGADFRDINNDGRPDIVMTALTGETFPLFLNEGAGVFTESTYQLGVGWSTSQLTGWGVGAYDFNNDGYKDLFTANSMVSENIASYSHERYELSNALFENQGGAGFRNVSAEAGPAFRVPRAHRGSAFGDLNNDGRIDVVVAVIGQPAEILFNNSPNGNHWLLLQAEGTRSNRDGIGARIKVTGESGFIQYNHVTTAVGYASSSDRRVHFGLGPDRRAREIEILWPSGTVQKLKDVPADQCLKVKEE